MVTEALIKIWKRKGKSEEWINKKLKEEGKNKVLVKKNNPKRLIRNCKKEFTATISFRISPFMAERLDRYVYQQLLYPTRQKGQIYRHIFENFLKRAYNHYGFDWNEGNLIEIQGKTTEEQR